jgi:hypothetical protein
VTLVFGWMLYDKIVTRKVDLKHALFEHDNFAAWLAFIGSFIAPIFFILSFITKDHAADTFFGYWLFSMYLVFICLLVLALYQIVLNKIFKGNVIIQNSQKNSADNSGKELKNFDVYGEIYEERNEAISIYVSFYSILIINVCTFFINSFTLNEMAVKLINIVITVLLGWAIYKVIISPRVKLTNEFFENNNTSVSISYFGFIGSLIYLTQSWVGWILSSGVRIGLAALILSILIWIFIYTIVIVLTFILFRSILKVDFNDEIVKQKNIGAALGTVALYIGVASLILQCAKVF